MATNTNRLAGIATVTVDGVAYTIVGSGTYRLSADTRETLKGQTAVEGYKSSPEAGRIAWKSRDSKNIDISALNDADDVTVSLALANGKGVVGRNMWRVGDPIEVDSEEASFDIAFEGADVVNI